MVLLPSGSVQLVGWLYPGSETGRRVFVDESGGIKFSVAAAWPLENLATAQMILKDCNQRMRKVVKQDRETLNDTALRPKHMYELGLCQKTLIKLGMPNIAEGECVVCGSEQSGDAEIIAQCSFCMSCVHGRCAQ